AIISTQIHTGVGLVRITTFETANVDAGGKEAALGSEYKNTMFIFLGEVGNGGTHHVEHFRADGVHLVVARERQCDHAIDVGAANLRMLLCAHGNSFLKSAF